MTRTTFITAAVGGFRGIGILLGTLVCTQPPLCFAQTLIFGEKAMPVTAEMRRAGDQIVVAERIGAAAVEAKYAVKSLRMEAPEPPQSDIARELLAQGKVDQAIGNIDPLLAYYENYWDIPGSWWAQFALLKSWMLHLRNRDAEAQPLLERVTRAGDPEAAEIARVRLLENLILEKKYQEAITSLDEIVSKPDVPNSVAAQAYLLKGDALLAQREYEPALIAYLRIPALYGKERILLSAALLGSARAYVGMNDLIHAKDSYKEVMSDFALTNEARIAKVELVKNIENAGLLLKEEAVEKKAAPDAN